ncbi:type II toxin-antitoxin system RelE family toxin [Celerinatantimonas sp. MCCC 1A17872]|uniref:type II toxin-antitoxin system RelE family toxin n=1 Tax=Celerinatantimonas sp. MCCC 1A17872 TaxID=3177514 RepID=UPI0038C0E54F
MTYELEFDPRAWKEWKKLGATVQQQFKKKLAEVVKAPRIEANRLRELPDCYKIKLRSSGFRLVYQVREEVITVFVLSVGKREQNKAYDNASKRID